MQEIDPVHIVALLACLGIACLIVWYWRHIVYVMVQCLSVLIACSGILFLIFSGIWPELPWLRALNEQLGFLDSLPRATVALIAAVFVILGIPLMILFRAVCLRLMPWLEIFSYPPALRNAFLAAGIQPARDPDGPLLSPRAIRFFSYGAIFCVGVLGPLIAFSLHGVGLATRALEVVSHIALLVLAFRLVMLGGSSAGRG